MSNSATSNQKQHVAGQISFLVCISRDNPSTVAARFAALRAQNSGGKVALLHVTQPPEFQHWAAVGKRMREEMRADAEVLLSGVKDDIRDMLNTRPSMHIREGRIGEEIINHVNENDSIDLLVVGATQPNEGRGSLISWLAGQLTGRLKIPLVIVPGNLTDKQLRNLT